MPAALAGLGNLAEGLFARCHRDPAGSMAWTRQEGRFQPASAAEFGVRVRRLAAGLAGLGIRAGDRVLLMAPNSLEWALLDFAILTIGAITVPLYPSLGQQELRYVLEDSGATAIFLESAMEYRRLPESGWGASRKRILLRNTDGLADSGLRSWAELEHSGPEMPEDVLAEHLAGTGRTDLASIVYTSGTTGWPKGVMLSHGNILSNIEGFLPLIPLRAGQRLLSVLPLSHIFERGTGHFGAYLLGLEVAYAERPDTVLRDMAGARPDIVITVPRILQLLYGRVRRNLADHRGWMGHFLRQELLGTTAVRRGRWRHRIACHLVARSLRKKMGGRIRYMVSGGAPLDPQICQFFLDLGLPVVEGYGMTEASPVISANPLEAIRPGSVGRFLPNLEGRIASDGEILVRGPSVMQGYWDNASATREALEDGWLHTGDVGEIDTEGYLWITDRKKDLIVNAAGENVAPQKIEMRLMAHPLISQAVVFGDRLPYLVALLYPHPELVDERLGPHADPQALQRLVGNAVDEALAGLPSFEQVRRFALLPEPLSETAGTLTPTLKIRRRRVGEQYADLLAGLAGKPELPAALPE